MKCFPDRFMLASVSIAMIAAGCGVSTTAHTFGAPDAQVTPEVDAAREGAGGSNDGGGSEACGPPEPTGRMTFIGDLSIEDDVTLASARSYTDVSGSVVVRPSFVGVVDWPNLVTVGGRFVVESKIDAQAQSVTWSKITRLRAPNLVSVGDEVWIYLNSKLVEVDLRRLGSTTRVFVDRNTELQMVRFDALPLPLLQMDASIPPCLKPRFPNASITYAQMPLKCSCTTDCGQLIAVCH